MRRLLPVLAVMACDYQLPDEPVVEMSSTSAVAAAVKYAIETRDLEADYHVAVITSDGMLAEALEDHVVRIATESAAECELTGELMDADGTPIALKRCSFPSGLVELTPMAERRSDGSYLVSIEEVARMGLITAPGHWIEKQPGFISYRFIVRWNGQEWDVELDENWGTEI